MFRTQASIMGAITEKCFICSKLGPNLSEIQEVRTFVKTQKVIWDHLLASNYKKQASFSFAWRKPRGE